MQVKVQLGASFGGKLTNGHDSNIMDVNLNMCKITSGFTSNMITKAVMDKLNRFSNITFSCPMKKGLYQISNYEADDSGFPTFILQNRKLYVTIKLFGKVEGVRRTTDLICMRAINEFK
jgi:hypothetical protein